MMKPYLLDVNLLIALLWPAHKHHADAQRWFRSRPRGVWATCPMTQCGFVRIVSNPTFSRDALSPKGADEYLTTNLAHPHHRFLADAIPFARVTLPIREQMQGHQQTTDAYLLGLAVHHSARLATLDQALGALAPTGSPQSAMLEVIKRG
jgi:toxin-antitoxin system PIN domain toxin